MTNATPQFATPKFTGPQAVLACLILVMAADGAPSKGERALLARLCATPHLATISAAAQTDFEPLALDILSAADGVDTLLELAMPALTPPMRQLAYALAADFVLANNQLTPEEMRVLDILAESCKIDRLTRAAIDRAAQIRYQVVV